MRYDSSEASNSVPMTNYAPLTTPTAEISRHGSRGQDPLQGGDEIVCASARRDGGQGSKKAGQSGKETSKESAGNNRGAQTKAHQGRNENVSQASA